MAEEWRQAKEIFNKALHLDLDEREAFLAGACSDNDPLRLEVESLLSSYDNVESFLEKPAVGEVADVMLNESRCLTPGTTFGHYKIVSQIGSGGMGQVYLAEDSLLKRQVAVKLLNNVSDNNPDHLSRFFQEARAASALNHPNILTIHEIGDIEGTNYIATEFVKGKTLRQQIRHDEAKLNNVLDIVIQLANALAAAHDAGIVHRDIKPDNIMLRDDGLVKVLDFGLAKLTQEKTKETDKEASTRLLVNTQAGLILGTVAYMSPEQARGKSVDARTDVWSIGVVLYEMLTGRQPFRGETSSDVMASILKTEPTPVTKLNNDIPDEIARIVSKTLQKDRDERYQSVYDLLVDLKQLKKHLEFENENTASPSQTETRIGNIPTANTERAVSSAEYLISEIRPHRLAFAAGTLVLLASIALSYWYFGLRAVGTSPIKSIAVLPLENLSGDPSQDYFADGMTDALLTELAKIGSLKIIARNSIVQYKGTKKKIAEIADELKVDAVVIGTVLRSGDKVRIATQMFRGSNDQNIWSNSYERNISDVLSLQDEVARGIVGEIKIKLTSEEQTRLLTGLPRDPNALEAYLQGMFYWNQAINFTGPREEGKALFIKSFGLFQQGINIEPKNAQLHASLAAAYHWLGSSGFPEYYPKSKEESLTALRLDETNSDAHAALAWVLWHHEWNLIEAEKELNRAIELNPNDSRHGYALLLSTLGRHAEALKAVEIGEPLDPLSIPYKLNIAGILINARRYSEAEKRLRNLIDVNPNNFGARRGLALALAWQGKHDEALAEQQQVVTAAKANPATNLRLAWIHAMAGRRDEAVNILNEAAKEPTPERLGVGFATVYSTLKENDEAIAWLEKALAAHAPALLDVKTAQSFDSLQGDPRFQDILNRVGF